MAQKEHIAQRKRELVSQLAEKRTSISLGRREIQKKFRPKNLLGSLLSSKPKSLFAGSAIAGLAASLFLRRPRKAKKAKAPQSTRILLLGWVLSLLKPAAQSWLVARAKDAAIRPPSTATRPKQISTTSFKS